MAASAALRTSLDTSGAPSANSSDTDLGAQNVTSKPATTGTDRDAVSRYTPVGSTCSRTRPRASASTSPDSPSRAAPEPTHTPGASLAPV